MPDKINFMVELTDTFGGEANYSWVKRVKISVKSDASDLKIIRAAKRALNLSGVRAKTERFGDGFMIRPLKMCMVAFVIYEDEA